MNIYDLVDQFRSQLLNDERRAASRLVAAYGEIWRGFLPRIQKLAQKGREQGVNHFYQLDRLGKLRRQVEQQLLRLYGKAGNDVRSQQMAAIRAALQHAEQLMLAGLGDPPPGVRIDLNRLPIRAIEAMVGFSADGSPLRDLFDGLANQGGVIVERGLLNGLAQGLGAMEIARQIRAGLGGNLDRALRIARTEVLRAYREATHQTYRANADIVTGWIWRSARNVRTCACCWALDGTFHSLEERLDDHPNGRCFSVPKMRTWAEMGYPTVGPDRVGQQIPGVEAFAALSPAHQRLVLGPAKYNAYAQGLIGLPDLIGQRNDPRWGSSRYERSLVELGINWREVML